MLGSVYGLYAGLKRSLLIPARERERRREGEGEEEGGRGRGGWRERRGGNGDSEGEHQRLGWSVWNVCKHLILHTMSL